MAPHDGLYDLTETLQCIVLHEKTDIRPIGSVHTAGLKALFPSFLRGCSVPAYSVNVAKDEWTMSLLLLSDFNGCGTHN